MDKLVWHLSCLQDLIYSLVKQAISGGYLMNIM